MQEIIGMYAFSHCEGVTDVSLPFSIVEIEAQAFICCSELRYIHIPRSVKKIGTFSFSECCNLTNIVLPDSISYIGDSAFAGMLQPSVKRRKKFCEFSRKPDGWDKNWTDKYSDVYWKDEWYYDENGNPVVKS